MSTPVQKNLVSKNEEYASSFTKGHLDIPPAKKYLVVTCMDARIDPAAAYGIDLGDAHIVRNAGGNAKDALRSIVISQQFLGTNEILVVKHTGCGMLTFDNAAAKDIVEKNLGEEGVSALSEFGGDFQPFSDLEGAVKSDVSLLKSSPLVSEDTTISGWIYECETGKVHYVV